MFISRRMRWAGLEACTGTMRNAYINLVGNVKERITWKAPA
jgi:hypothetical protein